MKVKKNINNMFYVLLVLSLFTAGFILLFDNKSFNFSLSSLGKKEEPQVDVDHILYEAKKILPNPDYIIDLDQIKVIWVSDKVVGLMGYKKEDLEKEGNIGLSKHHYDKGKFMTQFLERVSKKSGHFEFLTQKKDGSKILFDLEYKTLNHDDKEGYIVGKVVNYIEPTNEEVEEFEKENK